MNPHKHAEVIHHWAEGYTIQKKVYLCCEPKQNGRWIDCEVTPGWHEDKEYRVKPINLEKTEDV